MARDMKDSGIEWVGKIPVDWKVFPNKYIMKKVKEICFDWKGQPVMFLTIKGVIARDLENPVGKMPLTFNGYQFVYSGELLMCLFDYDVTPRCIGKILQDGVTSPAYSRFKLYSNASLNYYYYYYLMIDNTKELLHLAKNLRHSFTEEQLGALNVPVPSLEEQEKIANYLDKKIADIDLIIEKTKTTIEDYKKYKQSIITETVTKGLNPNIEMKDSGIEWIGEIPKHWEIKKMKYLLNTPLQYGANETGIQFDKNLPRYVRITDILTNNNLKEEGKLSLSEDAAKEFILSDGDLLFARSGGTVGKTFLYQNKFGKCAFAGYLIKADINKKISNSKFLYYYTLSSSYETWKNYIFIQSTIQNIGADKYSNLLIPVPFLKEQEKIVISLDKKVSEIDNLISKKENLINEMEEYKKSIIYECVTGKKEII